MGGASSYTRWLKVSDKGVFLQGMADCSCHARHPDHLGIVRNICQGRESCRIAPTSVQFGVKTQRKFLLFSTCVGMFIQLLPSDYLHSNPVSPNGEEALGDLLLQRRPRHKHCQWWCWWFGFQWLSFWQYIKLFIENIARGTT